MKSSFLVPQQHIPDPISQLKELTFFKAYQEELEAIQQTFSETKWKTFINKKLTKSSKILNSNPIAYIKPEEAKNAYQWVQSDNLVVLTLPNVTKEQITIDETKIISPLIHGSWIYPISNIQISNGKSLVVRFTVNALCPVLIINSALDKIDTYSALLLTVFCIFTKSNIICNIGQSLQVKIQIMLNDYLAFIYIKVNSLMHQHIGMFLLLRVILAPLPLFQLFNFCF